MYADDICLMTPSPAALKELIDICYDFSVLNDLSFNSSKLYGMVFKPKSYKLSCPRLYMDNQVLKYTDDIKYLGFTFSSDQKDDKDLDLLRQLRLLYTKSNRLLRLFYHCSTDMKIALFRSYCTCFYCPFVWTHYKKSTHSKLRVYPIYRRMLKLPPRSSASTMYAINNNDSFEVLIRKRIFGFTERLNNYKNTIIKCINNK